MTGEFRRQTEAGHVDLADKTLVLDRLGTTDDCGFSPFGDDTSTSRETAFEKIRARVEGTALASRTLEAPVIAAR